MTSLTAWERSFLYAGCSQAWAQQRQVLVDLQHLSHCSCWQAPLFSRNSLGTLRYGEVHLVSAARQNPLGHGNTVFAFLLSQSLEVQGKLAWCGYVPLLSVKCLTCTSCCLKRPIWKQANVARLGRDIKPATSCTSLQNFSSDSCPLHIPGPSVFTFSVLKIMHSTCIEIFSILPILSPNSFPSPLHLHQTTFTLCLTFMPHLCHYKTEENQALQV